MKMTINVIGGGFAGVEAAHILASHGIAVNLYEMKPAHFSPAHTYAGLCELVCSNSFKASRINSAAGLLKAEMKLLGSLTVPIAEANAVPAGGALAVDRTAFSDAVTRAIRENPLITIISERVDTLPDGINIIATGPLTDGGLAETIKEIVGKAVDGENAIDDGNTTDKKITINVDSASGACRELLHFFDAAAPIVTALSIDMNKAFYGSRYGRGGDDYINCPFDKAEYEAFYEALIHAESAPLHAIDRVYEGCMPIEVLAKRGVDSPRFGPMKPVGFTDPHTGRRPYALVQLRKETAAGQLFNIVGFQTNLKFGEQKRVFSLIPGLENAEFARYGVMHRNSFIDSPRLLNTDFSLKSNPDIIFAGQIAGVEGYMESAAAGLLAGLSLARKLTGQSALKLPKTTMTGALSAYISDESVTRFEPMGANMGILPPLENPVRDKQVKYQMLSDRAIADLEAVI
jgi:methylenetetrahydrofolate--tRNA-(uracil-5-)-methyltransferase